MYSSSRTVCICVGKHLRSESVYFREAIQRSFSSGVKKVRANREKQEE